MKKGKSIEELLTEVVVLDVEGRTHEIDPVMDKVRRKMAKEKAERREYCVGFTGGIFVKAQDALEAYLKAVERYKHGDFDATTFDDVVNTKTYKKLKHEGHVRFLRKAKGWTGE